MTDVHCTTCTTISDSDPVTFIEGNETRNSPISSVREVQKVGACCKNTGSSLGSDAFQFDRILGLVAVLADRRVTNARHIPINFIRIICQRDLEFGDNR